MESHVTGSGAPARVPFPQEEILVKHPLTGAMWNVAPLLELIHELGDDDPGNAARLRQVLRINNAVGAALDTVGIYTRQPA